MVGQIYITLKKLSQQIIAFLSKKHEYFSCFFALNLTENCAKMKQPCAIHWFYLKRSLLSSAAFSMPTSSILYLPLKSAAALFEVMTLL